MANRQVKKQLETIPIRILLPVVLTVVLFVTTIFLIILPLIEASLMTRKREMIHQLTESALSTLHLYAEKEQSGQMTRETAQSRAIEHLRRVRYGAELKDYFWINDMHPVMIMHPYRPDLEGRDISDLADPSGKRLFVAFVETVSRHGAGFVDYQWQWMDDPDRIVPKISYVKGFAPWNWILGTGIYVEDVRAEIAAITWRVMYICLGILALIIGLSFYIVWQGVGSEKERRKADAALKNSEEKYRLLAETAREFIIALDSNGRINYVNRAWIEAGEYSQDELLGMNIADILPHEQQESFNERMAGHRSGDRPHRLFETELRTRSGRLIPVEAASAPLMEQKAPLKVLVTARDITEKRWAEEQARIHQEQLFQADKMATLGTLVSGVAHEINNPIMFVMLNAPILRKVWDAALPILDAYHADPGVKDGIRLGGMPYPRIRDRVPQLLADLTDGANRVKAIVSDLKDFARQESSAMNDRIDINEVTRMAIGLVSNLIKKATSRFSVDYGGEIPTFQGNAQRIEQVIINLLVNACQSLPAPDRALTARTRYRSSDETLTITIADEGVGMTRDVLERIRDPFFTTKREAGGTGLGLAISDRIIEDHGGRIRFTSTPGKGTTVVLELPVEKKENKMVDSKMGASDKANH